jgi:hypothetical protein
MGADTAAPEDPIEDAAAAPEEEDGVTQICHVLHDIISVLQLVCSFSVARICNLVSSFKV